MIRTKLVRKYTNNGMTVEIRYFLPYKTSFGALNDGFYTIRFGYADGKCEYIPVTLIIHDIHDLNHKFSNFMYFIDKFELWNKQFKKINE